MLKRIGATAVALVSMLALGGFAMSASASATDVFGCYKISQFVVNEKGGQYKEAGCLGEPTKKLLEGEWILAEPLFKTSGNLWCALINLELPGGFRGNDGFFKDPLCKEKNTVANESDYTEIILPGLPDISVTLTGGKYPVHAVGSLATAVTTLSSASGAVLGGNGVTLLLLTTELSGLGTFTADFTNVNNPNNKENCHSTGDVSGVVLLGGEFHLVLSPNNLGILFLVSEFEITCGSLSLLVRGNLLGGLTNIGGEANELTGVGGVLEGKEGKQNISEYFNDGGTKVKAKLETEAGAGFVASAENVTGELVLSVLGSQMIVITNR
jgi:hypothetical protein